MVNHLGNWRNGELGDFVTLKRGFDLPQQKREDGQVPIFSSSGITGTHSTAMVKAPGVITGRYGTIGEVFYAAEDFWPLNTTLFVEDFHGNDAKFIYYFLKTLEWSKFTSASAVPGINRNTVHKEIVSLPGIETQRRIASTLSMLDEKIKTNTEINDNLEQQAMAIYRQMFVETNNDARRECRADEYFDISIGKTPPRKEAQWFSMNPTDCIWVSISDMGRCGMYIADSSEYLTHESVDKFNIKVVPDNTVLLSFKLTVGRVAITDGAMVTNEAIAHFKTDKLEINEYLYCYLKDFNYQTMGSTSSIATAVNSKIIKAMPFVVPTDAELVSFHSATAPMFEMIKTRQRENTRLAELRDSLLPKLMSGEIDVSDVQI